LLNSLALQQDVSTSVQLLSDVTLPL